jgi:hypothetical protein
MRLLTRVRSETRRRAVLDQIAKRSRLVVVGQPGGEAVAVVEDEFGGVLSVGRVVLGARGREGFAVLGQGLGMDRVEDEDVVLQEGAAERAAGLLEADGDGLA